MAKPYPPASERMVPGCIMRVGGANFDWAALLASNPPAKVLLPTVSDQAEATSPKDLIDGKAQSDVQTHPEKTIEVSTSMNAQVGEVAPTATQKPVMMPPSQTDRIVSLLEADTLDMQALKKLTWGGIPHEVRPQAWKLLLEYMPSSSARRAETLARKRQSYKEAVRQHYAQSSPAEEDHTIRQISVDIPRTCPDIALFRIPEVQAALERVLYVWSLRHPASGYVQGMNDLVTPFFFVFLSEHSPRDTAMGMLHWTSLEQLNQPELALANAEADAYWCMTALLNDIQDYYTFAQPGIQRRVLYLRDLVGRVDRPLKTHLDKEGLDFLQFAFRWMNCLLMRELPFPLIVRVWDTYLSEPDGFALFHVFVCAALLVEFSNELQEMDFQDMVMFLQHLPTEDWTTKEMDVVLSQAYMWRTIFSASPSHLQIS